MLGDCALISFSIFLFFYFYLTLLAPSFFNFLYHSYLIQLCFSWCWMRLSLLTLCPQIFVFQMHRINLHLPYFVNHCPTLSFDWFTTLYLVQFYFTANISQDKVTRLWLCKCGVRIKTFTWICYLIKIFTVRY